MPTTRFMQNACFPSGSLHFWYVFGRECLTDEPPIEIPGTKFLGFPGASVVKTLPANAGDVSSVPGLGRSPGEGNGNPLQYSCLGNPLDRAAWQAANSQPCAMTVQLNVQLVLMT